MIEINCQIFLNQYLDKDIVCNNDKEFKNKRFILETKLLLNLILKVDHFEIK